VAFFVANGVYIPGVTKKQNGRKGVKKS